MTRSSSPSSKARSSNSVPSASSGWRRIKAATTWPASASSSFVTSVEVSIWSASASRRPESRCNSAAGPTRSACARKWRGRPAWLKRESPERRRNDCCRFNGKEKQKRHLIDVVSAKDDWLLYIICIRDELKYWKVEKYRTLLQEDAGIEGRSAVQVWDCAHHDALLLYWGTCNARQTRIKGCTTCLTQKKLIESYVLSL